MTGANEILNGIRALDGALAPLGIYGSDRGLIFTKVVYPVFKSRGFRVSPFGKTGREACFDLLGASESQRLELISVSKVKVRQFGSQHRVDLKIEHDERWDEKKVQRIVSNMGRSTKRDRCCFLLFIGYAAEAEPFHRELKDLQDSLDWDARGISFESLSWQDPHGRGFFTRACIWSAPKPV